MTMAAKYKALETPSPSLLALLPEDWTLTIFQRPKTVSFLVREGMRSSRYTVSRDAYSTIVGSTHALDSYAVRCCIASIYGEPMPIS